MREGAQVLVATWCESRAAFRGFRVHRIEALRVQEDRFDDEPGKTPPDCLRGIARRPVLNAEQPELARWSDSGAQQITDQLKFTPQVQHFDTS